MLDFRSIFSTAALAAVLFTSAHAQSVSTLGDSFNASGGVAVDAAGNIYVADFGQALNNANGTMVWKITPEGVRTVFASGLQGASGNAFDSQGNLFQSNIAAGTVSKIDPSGTVTLFSTGHASPVGVAIAADPTGTLLYINSAVPTFGTSLNPVLLRVLALDITTEVVVRSFGSVKAQYR